MHRSKWLLRTALVGTLAMGFHATSPSSAIAQGVPVVDTQNIAQNIQQLRQMIEDEILQNEQLVQLREQLATLTDQLAELQRTYEALTRLAELPEIIRTQMEDELNGLLDQEFGDIIATIADNSRSKANILPHLHISFGVPSPKLVYHPFVWNSMRDSRQVKLLDPLDLIDWPHAVLDFNDQNFPCKVRPKNGAVS